MRKEEITYKKEIKANKEMGYVYLLVIACMLFMMLLECLDIFILPKVKTMMGGTAIILIAAIPAYIILVMKINEKWTKYMVVTGMGLIAAVCYAIFTFHMTIMVIIPVLIASVYNSKKLLHSTTIMSAILAFIAHIVAPFTTINVDDPLYTVEFSILYGFLPRLLFIVAVGVICQFNVTRFDSTIDNVLEYGEELEKSNSGMKRIFIECQEMLHSENTDAFLKNVGGAMFRIIKYLKGNRQIVPAIIIIKDEKDEFVAMNELYERQDDKLKEDERYIYIEFDGKEYKIVKENDQNEGNIVTSGEVTIMTYYDREKLIGFVATKTLLNMNEKANSVIMNVLYNSIRLCITTKQAENLIIESQEQLIYQFSIISESKSKETGCHIRRVSEYMREFGKSICKTQRECDNLACASMLHDVGKLIVPSAVLNKPGKLTSEEFEIIKKHTDYGSDLLKDVPGEMMLVAKNIAEQHHERWDGTGYKGLKGEEIDFYARYVSVIDVFDALISKRCYKDAWSLEDAYKEIVSKSGTQFAPEAVELFKEKYDTLVEIYNKYPDA